MRRSVLPDHPFDKKRFQETLKQAMGSRKQSEFCIDADLSYTHINRYMNRKMEDAPTIQTIKKISAVAESVSFEEILEAAGYDSVKYKNERPKIPARKDYLYPIIIGLENSDYDWKLESGGCKDKQPFEIVIERNDVKKWFFIPVVKESVNMEDIMNFLLGQTSFIPGSKVSLVTDSDAIFEKLKKLSFPLLSLYVSVIRINGQRVEEEISIKTALETDITICYEDLRRPLMID